MNLLELVLGQIPEAIYFALFMINTKQLKEKRLLYVVLMIVEYLLLTAAIKFNVWMQVLYTVISFIILKFLYKERAQVTDIFTFTIASIVLILISAISFGIISMTIRNKMVAYIIKNILMLIFIVVTRNKLTRIQKLYRKLWNRNDKVKKKMKTTTFRSLNVIIFNMIFWIINIGMVYAMAIRGGR
jgi:hypothetical protein